ncbi:hypothetical protein CDD83_470 [Cordyceps sp. RAO-2017]|nr:hypothetical protein CDD83_470 [Cordyceps sp. RAO-2017]
MKFTPVAVLALCLAESGLAAPTRAVSSQLSQRDVAALQAIVKRDTELQLTATEAEELVAGLINGLRSVQIQQDGIKKRSADQDLAALDNGIEAKGKGQGAKDKNGGNEGEQGNGAKGGKKAGKGDPLGILIGSLSGATDGLGGLLGGGKKKGGLLGGALIPGILKREATSEQNDALATIQTGGDLKSLVENLLGQKKGGLLGGALIPGLLKRDEATEQARMVEELSDMIRERLLSNLLSANEMHQKRQSDLNVEQAGREDGGLLGEGVGGLLESLLGLLGIRKKKGDLVGNFDEGLGQGRFLNDLVNIQAGQKDAPEKAGSGQAAGEDVVDVSASTNFGGVLGAPASDSKTVAVKTAVGKLSQAKNSTTAAGTTHGRSD